MAVGTLRRKLTWAAAVLVAAVAGVGRAAAEDCRVAAVPDGQTLACEDGRLLRLAGLRAPRAAPWDGEAPPFAAAARAGLARLAQGRRVTWEAAAPDRHGRLRAQLRRDDGTWLQQEMLRQGLAMVETQRDSRDAAEVLLGQEAEARGTGQGLWSHRRYRVQSAEEVRAGGWRIVEGQVLRAEKRKGVVYLNFGTDWRSDFTVRLTGAVLRDFSSAGRDILGVQGRRVRVRGWVDWHNGPELVPDHLEQIEVLD